MNRSGASEGLGRTLRYGALAVLALAILLAMSGFTLTLRGRAALERSDAAFHRRQMRESISWARDAALFYVPGSDHVKGAYARLEAVARGAESEGDQVLARIAWDTLRVVIVQTDYLGRPPIPQQRLAEENVSRLRAAEAAHSARQDSGF